MKRLRLIAAALTASMIVGLTGCTQRLDAQSGARNPGPQYGYEQQAPPRQGMSNKQKVLLLAGAAALYYIYNKHKNSQGAGPQGQHYRSKNGGIYYRDKSGKPHWVTAPQQPIQVPAEEYERVTGQRAAGYEGRVIREAPAGW
jgi:hypothetical protein